MDCNPGQPLYLWIYRNLVESGYFLVHPSRGRTCLGGDCSGLLALCRAHPFIVVGDSDVSGMEYVRLGRDGPKVSAVGLGMWQAGGSEWGSDVTDEGCVAAIRRAHEFGVTLIDTAEVYGQGHSEEVVGRAIREIGRDELVVATKVSGGHLRPEHVKRACEKSLERLGVSEIDLYQVHWVDSYMPLKATMRALEMLHREGKIGSIGVSNFAVRDLEEARTQLSGADIVANQVHFSLLYRDAEMEILPYCVRESISVLAWSPLEKGLLTGKYRVGFRPDDEIRKNRPLFRDGNLAEAGKLVAVLERIGKSHGRTPGQVALNWLRGQGPVVPIPGAKNAMQAEENAGAVGWTLAGIEARELSETARTLALDTF